LYILDSACGGQLLRYGAPTLSTRTVVINQASMEIVGSKSQYTIVFSVCQSVVVCKERLQLFSWGSYNGVGNSHFVARHRVAKYWRERLLPSFYTSMHLNTSGRE
jgi:hypothetical protein